MLKKTFLVGTMGFLIFSLSLAPFQLFATDYHFQCVGSQFVPRDETYVYDKYTSNFGCEHEGPSSGYYYVGVELPQRAVGSYFLKSMNIQYYDNDTTGYISVRLKRRNHWTGIINTVATWTDSAPNAPGWSRVNVATIDGYKFVDTAKFVYFLEIYYSNAASNKVVYQIRIHYSGP